MPLSAPEIQSIWVNNGGNPAAAPMAAAIALAESSGNPNAVSAPNTNGTIDRGLWQVNSVHGPQSTTNLLGNVRAAINISNNGRNWQPWSTYNNGAYKAHLGGQGRDPDGGVSGGHGRDLNVGGVTSTPGSSTSSSRTTVTLPKTDVGQAGIDALVSAGNKPIDTSGKFTASTGVLGQLMRNINSGAYTTPGSSHTTNTNSTTLPGSVTTRGPGQHPGAGAPQRGSGLGGGFIPQGAGYTSQRQDQGRDGVTKPGGAIIAPGAGYVIRVASDPGGFGPRYPIVHFTTGPYAGRNIYLGHTLSAVTAGQHFGPGETLSHTGWGVGNATVPGWFEIGFAPGGSPGPNMQPAPFK